MRMKYITLSLVTCYIGAAEAGSHPEIQACAKINKEMKGVTCDIYRAGDITLRIDIQKASADERLYIDNLHKQFMQNNTNGRLHFFYIESNPEWIAKNKVLFCMKKSSIHDEACVSNDNSDYAPLKAFSIFKGKR